MPPTSKPGTRIALAIIRSALPTGKGWFSDWALHFGEIANLARAMAVVAGDFLETARKARDMFFRKQAKGIWLDSWGSDLGILRKAGESDEDYQARIDAELFRPRSVRKDAETGYGVESFIESRTGLTTTVGTPWRQEMKWDGDLLWGDAAPFSNLYYSGGNAEIITEDFSAETRQAAIESTDPGVKLHFIHRIGDDLGDPRSKEDFGG